MKVILWKLNFQFYCWILKSQFRNQITISIHLFLFFFVICLVFVANFQSWLICETLLVKFTKEITTLHEHWSTLTMKQLNFYHAKLDFKMCLVITYNIVWVWQQSFQIYGYDCIQKIDKYWCHFLIKFYDFVSRMILIGKNYIVTFLDCWRKSMLF